MVNLLFLFLLDTGFTKVSQGNRLVLKIPLEATWILVPS